MEATGLEPANLLTASQALYQLSYAPERFLPTDRTPSYLLQQSNLASCTEQRQRNAILGRDAMRLSTVASPSLDRVTGNPAPQSTSTSGPQRRRLRRLREPCRLTDGVSDRSRANRDGTLASVRVGSTEHGAFGDSCLPAR